MKKLGDLETLRSHLSCRYEWMFAQLASELDLIRSAPLAGLDLEVPEDVDDEKVTELRVVEGGDSPASLEGQEAALTLYQRVYLVAGIMRRMTEVTRRHAQVLGLQTDSGTQLNIGPGAGAGQVLALTKVEAPDDPADQERAAEHLRDLSRLLGLAGS